MSVGEAVQTAMILLFIAGLTVAIVEGVVMIWKGEV